MTFQAQQSRVDALVRLLGLVILVFGVLMLYYTYSNATGTGVAPEIVTVNYSLGLLLSVVGLFATFSRFK